MHIKTKDEWAGEKAELLAGLGEFAEVMKGRPFQNEAGLRGVSAFALYWFIKQLQPTLVFEVGVWRGFSTWLIEQAAPEAEIWGFDPLFFFGGEPAPTYRSPRVRYFREDFSCAELRSVVTDPEHTVAFFDDHHRQFGRLEQCRRVGIRHLIYDDNPPCPYSNRTLEDERRDPLAAPHLEAMIDRYEVFPALWAVDDATEYPIKESGLDFPIAPDTAYVYNERKWHSYVTYVRATEATEVEMNRTTSYASREGDLRSVRLESAPAPALAVVGTQGPETVDLLAKLATSTSAAISNLNLRLSELETRLPIRMTVVR